ncbi:YceI family protein [Brucella pituitosa]|uniref:YceI family protein n=1 Tax=Brucella pituitosa TaxID=571256 RepID=UPI003F4AA082
MFRPFAIAMVIAAMPGSSHADTFVVASGHYTIQQSSQIAFTVSQVGGGGLGGSFGEFTGNLELDAQNLSRSSVSLRLRPASVDARQSRITDFLKSSAVFDVRNYPVLTFESTRITQTGPRTARIDGMLTARGKTHGETFFAALVGNDAKTVTFHVTGDVLRSPYGMDVGTPIYSNVVKFEMNLRGAK